MMWMCDAEFDVWCGCMMCDAELPDVICGIVYKLSHYVPSSTLKLFC